MAPPSRPAPADRTLAFCSDVHGNREALEAVVAELEARDVKDVVVAGDLLLGGDDPLGTWRLLQRIGARCVRGLGDAALSQVDPASLEPSDEAEHALAERFSRTREAVGDLVVKQLEKLPEKLRIPMIDGGEIVVVHGSPADALIELTHDLGDEEILALVADDPADVVICGASHVPFDRTVAGVRVVNVGSVGDAPEGRFAHFTLLTPRVTGPEIEQLWAEY